MTHIQPKRCQDRGRILRAFSIAAVVTCIPSPAGAATPTAVTTAVTEPELANWAFAPYLGTGYYTAADHAVEVLTVPISYTLREVTDDRAGIVINFPLTLGFYDFKALSLIESGPLDDIATVSIIPGVEYQMQILPDWMLAPFIDLGGGISDVDGIKASIYSAGLKSYFHFRWGTLPFLLANRLLYAGYSVSESDAGDEFGSFETGLDMRLPFSFSIAGHDSAVSVYVANFLYFNNLEFLRPANDPLEVHVQYEAGVTVGTNKPVYFGPINIPRLGIGYRFGDDVSVTRILFGMPF